MNKKILMLLTFLTILLASCTEADQVSHNISKEADNFNVVRRVAVINTRTDKVEFEEINIEENEEALEQIKAIGLKRLPVVIGMKNNSVEFAFSGFQLDLLDELVQ